MSNYVFSERSRSNMHDVHPDLRLFLEFLLDYYDFAVVSGLRTAAEQAKLVAEGSSTTMNSKHLRQDTGYAHAVDIHPFVDGKPLNYKRVDHMQQWYFFVGLARGLWELYAARRATQYSLRIGADWDSDYSILDNSFDDLFHFELIRK